MDHLLYCADGRQSQEGAAGLCGCRCYWAMVVASVVAASHLDRGAREELEVPGEEENTRRENSQKPETLGRRDAAKSLQCGIVARHARLKGFFTSQRTQPRHARGFLRRIAGL